jgi:pimeloyl-ACP methyl ester carboxylesterase
MAEILLIHGAGFGAWAWEAVIAALAARGHSARALDLPGRGGAETTLQAQVKAVVAALQGPTVLIGHSAGGLAVSAAAEAAPDLVTGLIYVAAYVPRAGLSLADLRRAGPAQPMQGAFRLTPDRRAYGFTPERCEALFFHDCTHPAAVTAQLCLEPLAPHETPLPQLSRLETLPRAAVICEDDRAIPPGYQRQMATGMAQVALPSGHCPFLSMPDRLAGVLNDLIRSRIENTTNFVAR